VKPEATFAVMKCRWTLAIVTVVRPDHGCFNVTSTTNTRLMAFSFVLPFVLAL
jgi:hypothetical protein